MAHWDFRNNVKELFQVVVSTWSILVAALHASLMDICVGNPYPLTISHATPVRSNSKDSPISPQFHRQSWWLIPGTPAERVTCNLLRSCGRRRLSALLVSPFWRWRRSPPWRLSFFNLLALCAVPCSASNVSSVLKKARCSFEAIWRRICRDVPRFCLRRPPLDMMLRVSPRCSFFPISLFSCFGGKGGVNKSQLKKRNVSKEQLKSAHLPAH